MVSWRFAFWVHSRRKRRLFSIPPAELTPKWVAVEPMWLRRPARFAEQCSRHARRGVLVGRSSGHCGWYLPQHGNLTKSKQNKWFWKLLWQILNLRPVALYAVMPPTVPPIARPTGPATKPPTKQQAPQIKAPFPLFCTVTRRLWLSAKIARPSMNSRKSTGIFETIWVKLMARSVK